MSFMKGIQPEEEIDIRGTTVPDPPVDSIEELQQRLVKTTVTVNGVKSGDEVGTQPAESSDAIDISKLDIRVGVIKKAWEHEEAEKLFCEEIDVGDEEGPRLIASGLRAHYSVDDLPGQRVLVLANLKARKMMGFSSHGMVLCAASDDGMVRFVEPPEGAKVGDRVTVEGFEGEPATENQIIKKKMLEAIFPDLKTDADGIASYKRVPLSTSAGPCKPTFPNADIA